MALHDQLLPPASATSCAKFSRFLPLFGISILLAVAAAIVTSPLVSMKSHGDSLVLGTANSSGSGGRSYNLVAGVGGQFLSRGGGYEQKIAEKKQLLLIIDMQNDYDLTYNMNTYGYKKNPWANQLLSASKHIQYLIDDVDWDMIAFSQDWLIPMLISGDDNHKFCLRNTPGASPLQELLDAADKKTSNQLRYTKNVDDVFNNGSNWHFAHCNGLCQVPENYPTRGYDTNNTYDGKLLFDVLKDRGYTPSNTKITVAGTEADMCVLTSTLHALQHGFEIDVYEPGVNGGWSGPGNSTYCGIPLPGSSETLPHDWKKVAFECQGAAGRAAALYYMEAAGARILWQLPSFSRDLA